MSSSPTVNFKVVLLGEGRVGKTCLTLRYVQNEFSSLQESTLQATFLEKKINFGKRPVKLVIWDTAGQERFRALGPIYYRESNGALLVYDITDRESFTKVRDWVKELRKIVGQDISIMIVGNKIDLEKQRQVEEKDATEYAKSVGAQHFLCSAKTGKNVEMAFIELTKAMIKRYDEERGGTQTGGDNSQGNSNPVGSSRTVSIAPEEDTKNNSSCC